MSDWTAKQREKMALSVTTARATAPPNVDIARMVEPIEQALAAFEAAAAIVSDSGYGMVPQVAGAPESWFQSAAAPAGFEGLRIDSPRPTVGASVAAISTGSAATSSVASPADGQWSGAGFVDRDAIAGFAGALPEAMRPLPEAFGAAAPDAAAAAAVSHFSERENGFAGAVLAEFFVRSQGSGTCTPPPVAVRRCPDAPRRGPARTDDRATDSDEEGDSWSVARSTAHSGAAPPNPHAAAAVPVPGLPPAMLELIGQYCGPPAALRRTTADDMRD